MVRAVRMVCLAGDSWEVRGRIHQAIRSTQRIRVAPHAMDRRAACRAVGSDRWAGALRWEAITVGSIAMGTRTSRPGQLWPGERYGDSLPCVHAPKVVKP